MLYTPNRIFDSVKSSIDQGWCYLSVDEEMLEAEISRFTGLVLVEAVEIATIVASVIAATGLIVTGIIYWKQNKVSSATLVSDLLKPWGKQKFKLFLNQLADPKITKYDEKELEEFLNQLEIIATFWKDGTLTGNHVKELFGANVKTVRTDKFIKDYMKYWVDKNPKYFFANLTKLVKKSEEWNI